MKRYNDNEIKILSFLTGFISLFSFGERRIDMLKEHFASTSSAEMINCDWQKVGTDLFTALHKITGR